MFKVFSLNIRSHLLMVGGLGRLKKGLREFSKVLKFVKMSMKDSRRIFLSLPPLIQRAIDSSILWPRGALR